MDDYAEIKDYQIVRTVIRSNRRFTYEEAQTIIETGEGDYKEEMLKLNEWLNCCESSVSPKAQLLLSALSSF